MKIQVFGRLPPDTPRWLAESLEDIANQVNGLSTGAIYSTYNAYTAAPTTGTYAQGDFVKNSAPTGGSPTIGWIFTVSGTPGTWVAVAVGGGGGVSDGDKGDITVSGGGGVWDLDLTLDQINVATSSVNFNDQQALSFRIENRTSDPGTPTTGQIWLRTDL